MSGVTFKLSSDPLFFDKVRDIVGLYISPPNSLETKSSVVVHTSTAQVEADIRHFIDQHNAARSLSDGPNPPTISSPPSNASAKKTEQTLCAEL